MHKKTHFTILCAVFLTSQIAAQISSPRKLQIFKETPDSSFTGYYKIVGGKTELVSVEPTVKRDKDNVITSLWQQIFTKEGKKIFMEEYKKGKKWNLFHYANDSLQIYYSFREDGKIESEQFNRRTNKDDFDNQQDFIDKNTIKFIFYDYYPSGQLKNKVESRSVRGGIIGKVVPWNVLEYFYPDGKPYTDWGTLKDGKGYYNILDEHGKVCDVCTEKLKKEMK